MTVSNVAQLARFKELMLERCGFSFEKERETALAAGLRRRMALLGISDQEEYHALLKGNEGEFHRLVELLTINETYFFREPEHLKLLIDRLIPEIVETREQGPVRIVSAGCSTGEEPYSIAMLLREKYGAESGKLFSIVGVDIDATVIARARQGVYGRGSFRGTDQRLIERYFEPAAPGEYRIREEIRREVGFEVVNLLGTTYPTAMQMPDVILYRNVSIYFPGQVQHRIFSRLAELLTEGGYLLVGATETIHHDLGILTLMEKDALFFYSKLPKLRIEDRRSQRRLDGVNAHPSVAVTRRPAPPATLAHKPAATVRPDRAPRAPGPPAAPEHRVSSVTIPDTHVLFDDALEMAHNNQADKAIELLDSLLERDSSFVKAYSLKSSILLSASRFDEARDVCTRALASDPLCLEASLMLGIIARHDENGEEAVKRFREAIYLDSSCWPAHFYTAEIVYSQGDRKRARSGYESTLRILENGPPAERKGTFFPLMFKPDQFVAICRHKLSLLKDHGK